MRFRTFSLALELARAEGLRALADRAAERWSERQARAAYPAARLDELPRLGPVPVLQVLPTPLAARLGGIQAQLLARRSADRARHPTALLYRHRDRWRLEVDAAERRATDLGPAPSLDALVATGPAVGALLAAVQAATAALAASGVHLEATTDLPPAALAALARAHRLVVSQHDFGLVVPPPHVFAPSPAADPGRPRRQPVGSARPLSPDTLARYQQEARDALLAAAATVYPSAFLRDAVAELLGLDGGRAEIVEPAIAADAALAPDRRRDGARRLRHVALVGRVDAAKGGEVFREVVERVRGEHPRLRWSVLGGGAPGLLADLRATPGVEVHGYYPSGSLPRRLRQLEVDLVLLLSRVPESYCLTLDECLRAGVPVLAFAAGALAERVPRYHAGVLVPPDRGAAGVAAALCELLSAAAAPEVPAASAAALPTPASAARRWATLYQDLGLLP